MANRTRARGDREPKGKTKSAILMFLANSGESTFTQVREHLQEQHNIRSTKDVKIHLADLSSDDGLALVEKISHSSGNANSYRIRSGFNSLKRLHSYLGGLDGVPALMRTRYFLEYTDTMDFETKARTNISRNTLLELYEGIMDDRGHEKIKALLNDIDENDREAMASWMDRVRAGDRADPLSGSFLALIDLLKEGDIDRLGDIFVELVRMIGEERGRDDLLEFFALMTELSIPPDKQKMAKAARRISPGALDYLLNSSKNNRMFPPNIFLAYVYSLILQAPPGEAPESLPPVDFARYRRYVAAIPRHTGESPVAMIVRSLFIADMIHGRLVVDEVPEETLRLVFS
jgi:hypothetical protein